MIEFIKKLFKHENKKQVKDEVHELSHAEGFPEQLLKSGRAQSSVPNRANVPKSCDFMLPKIDNVQRTIDDVAGKSCSDSCNKPRSKRLLSDEMPKAKHPRIKRKNDES